MNAHFLQHVPFEGLGSIDCWLRRQDALLTSTRFFLNEPLPSIRGSDFIIAGPGPMSVNDEATLPWLKAEKQFLRDAITRGIPVLGICLGAQLIASSLGARVYPNSLKEIGWFPIQSEKAPDHCFQFPARCTVFHWHGETLELPKEATRLARSPACDNQGFQLGRNVIGLQFHLETTPEGAAMLIEHCRHEMIPGPYVQSEAQIRAVPAETYATANSVMDDLLNRLVRTTG
jgi:GMP synthase-like glutamine amidotransferase